MRAGERLTALNSEIRINAHTVELKAANVRAVLAGYDVVIDGTDRLSTRYLVNDACVIYGKALVSAAIHRFEGQLMTYVPNQGPCYRCLFPDGREALVANCAEAGVLGVLPGVLGTLQATEAIKLITGVGEPLTGRLLTYDALDMRFQEFRVSRRRDCAVCGDAPSITEPRDQDPLPAGAAPGGVRRLSANDLRSTAASQHGLPRRRARALRIRRRTPRRRAPHPAGRVAPAARRDPAKMPRRCSSAGAAAAHSPPARWRWQPELPHPPISREVCRPGPAKWIPPSRSPEGPRGMD